MNAYDKYEIRAALFIAALLFISYTIHFIRACVAFVRWRDPTEPVDIDATDNPQPPSKDV